MSDCDFVDGIYFDEYGEDDNLDQLCEEFKEYGVSDDSGADDVVRRCDRYEGWTIFTNLGLYKTNIIWNTIVLNRYLDFETPTNLCNVKKATLVLKATRYLMTNRKHESFSCGFSKTLGILEWLVLPRVTGSKSSLTLLRKITKEVYLLAFEYYCAYLFEERSNQTNQSHPDQSHIVPHAHSLSPSGAAHTLKNPNDVMGYIKPSARVDFIKMDKTSKDRTIPFIGTFGFKNKTYFIPSKKGDYAFSSGDESC